MKRDTNLKAASTGLEIRMISHDYTNKVYMPWNPIRIMRHINIYS
jgi:hypothetical protein